jgi:hypothetical protein
MSKLKKHQKLQESYISDHVDRPTNNHGPKFDLMSLGIELDDNLIERLQKNLGIEKIFSIAQKSASLIKSKPFVPVGAVPEMTYRNVSDDGIKRNSSVSRPFERDMPHTDNKFSMTILKELSDSESRIEGKYRPLLDKMVERYRLQYMRSPERFVCCLLGRTMKASDHHGTDSMSRLVLRARYVGAEDFAVMIRRVDSAAETEHIDALFHLFAVDKSFGNSVSHGALSNSIRRRGGDILDLWEFLTLLKTSADEARRSFDCRTSRLATDVEFWKRSNFNMSVTGGRSTSSGGDPLMDTNERFQAERNRRINGMASNTQRCFDSKKSQPTSGQSGANETRNSQSRGGQVLTVSQLLGHTPPPVSPVRSSAHGSKGTLVKERRNQCDIPTALNSPLRNAPPSPRKSFAFVSSSRANQVDDRPSYNTFGGSRVGDLLGSSSSSSSSSGNKINNSALPIPVNSGSRPSDDSSLSYTAAAAAPTQSGPVDVKRSQSALRERPTSSPLTRSASFLAREFTNKTSVADALSGASEGRPRAVSSGHRSRQFSRSFSQSEGSFAHNAWMNGASDGAGTNTHCGTAPEESVAAVMGASSHESTSSTFNRDGSVSARRCGSMWHLATDANSLRKGTSLW